MPPPPEKTFNMEPENQSLELEFPSFSGSMYVKLGGGVQKNTPRGVAHLRQIEGLWGFHPTYETYPKKNIPESNSSHLKIGGFELEYDPFLSFWDDLFFFSVRTC